MTEAWKSNPHYYCEVCKVWMNDNPSARATHERGIKHQENVSRKLRDMRKKAESDKKEEAVAVASMSSIEAKARRQFEQDMKESAKAKEELTGKWENDEASGYLYNAQHRFYYDSSKGMYYGGDPPAWTLTPDIPSEGYYRHEQEQKPPVTSTSGRSAATKPTLRPGMRATNNHPMANLGGYQMPLVGQIGGAKGVGSGKTPVVAANGKRARDEAPQKGGKAQSKEEKEAIARREAARARVQQRTMQAFGLR